MGEFTGLDESFSKDQLRMREAGFDPVGPDLHLKDGVLVQAGAVEDRLYGEMNSIANANVQGFVTIKTQPFRNFPSTEGVYIAVNEHQDGEEVVKYRSMSSGQARFMKEDDEISAVAEGQTIVDQLYLLGYSDLVETDEQLLVADSARTSIIGIGPNGDIDVMYRDLDITHGPAQPGLGAKVVDMHPEENEYGSVEQQIRMSNGWADFTISASYPASAEDIVFHREPTFEEINLGPFQVHIAEVEAVVADPALPIERIDEVLEINSYPVADIEAYMRAGRASVSGFLGENEGLLVTIKNDSETVRQLGLQHVDLATPLLYVERLNQLGFVVDTSMDGTNYIEMGGHPYAVEVIGYRGYQDSPFGDGDKSSKDFSVTNMKTGASVGFSGLIGGMIQKYGFYEGRGVGHRVDPIDILRTFDQFSGIGSGLQIPEDDPIRKITSGQTTEGVLTTEEQLKRYEKLRHIGEGLVVNADAVYQPQNFADAARFLGSDGYGERASIIGETFLDLVEPTIIDIAPRNEQSYSYDLGVPLSMLPEASAELYEALYDNVASVDTTALNSPQIVDLFDKLLKEDAPVSERSYVQASVPSAIRRSLINKLVIDDYRLPITLYTFGFEDRHSSRKTLNRDKLVGIIELFEDRLPDLEAELDRYGIDRENKPVAEQIADLYTSLQPGIVKGDRSVGYAKIEEVLPEITAENVEQIEFFTRIIHGGGELNEKQNAILARIGLDPDTYTNVAQNSRNGTGWLIRETLHGENYRDFMKN